MPKSGSVSEVQPGYRVRIRSVFFKGQEYEVRIAGPDHNCKDFQNKNHVNTFYKVAKKSLLNAMCVHCAWFTDLCQYIVAIQKNIEKKIITYTVLYEYI